MESFNALKEMNFHTKKWLPFYPSTATPNLKRLDCFFNQLKEKTAHYPLLKLGTNCRGWWWRCCSRSGQTPSCRICSSVWDWCKSDWSFEKILAIHGQRVWWPQTDPPHRGWIWIYEKSPLRIWCHHHWLLRSYWYQHIL